MFAMGAATRIYVATGATDTRKGFNGLEGLVRERLACDPTSGHSFLFANGRRDRLKLVFFDGSGLWVCAKRMEGGRLCWPEAEGGKVLLWPRPGSASGIAGPVAEEPSESRLS
jgi:transposase